jgi:hypothetical protein
MTRNINYFGRTTPLPEAKALKYRHIAVPEWAIEDCWLHGGKQIKAECQGCLNNFDSDRDYDGMVEAIMGEEL